MQNEYSETMSPHLLNPSEKGGKLDHLPDPDRPECEVTLFVACYNEAEGIIPTLDTAILAMRELELDYEIIVIDDGSRDDSVALVRDYIRRFPKSRVYLKVNKFNEGLGYNYVDAAFLGRGRYFRFLSGDDAEPKESLVKIFSFIGKADMIVPYHCDFHGRTFFRSIVSRTYTRIVNALSGRALRYYNGSAVQYRHNIMRWHSYGRGFGFQADMLCRMLDLGASYIEVPIVGHERRQASCSSALTLRNILSVSHTFLEIFIRRMGGWVYNNRRIPHNFDMNDPDMVVLRQSTPTPGIKNRHVDGVEPDQAALNAS